MYFYVDESGQTGSNLFDENQPILYYGVLSSEKDLDSCSFNELEQFKKQMNLKRLHASELGIEGLNKLLPILNKIHKECNFQFDIWHLDKQDFPIISYFDQVFDQGINPAVSWSAYWTPLRYDLLLKLAYIFDKKLAHDAWKARLEPNDSRSYILFESVSKKLLSRIKQINDWRAEELIHDAISWSLRNYSAISYNCKMKTDKLFIMPNIILFQSVLLGINHRITQVESYSKVIVDEQSQFNTQQKRLSDIYSLLRDRIVKIGPGLPEMDLKNLHIEPLIFKSNNLSNGLQLVDIYLWLFKRYLDNQTLSPQLIDFINQVSQTTLTSSISLKAIAELATDIFSKMDNITSEDIRRGREFSCKDEIRRKKHTFT